MLTCDAGETARATFSRIAIISPLCVLSVLCVPSLASETRSRRPAGTEWDQLKKLFTLVQEVALGQPAPQDVTLSWHSHFVNADAGVVLVPFTLAIEQGTFTAFPLAMYVRVVPRGAPAPAPGPRDALAQYPFEDAAIVERIADNRITRAFTAPPGVYDVYVAIAETPVPGHPPAKRAVLKQPIDVPDLNGGLTTSSIIMADAIEIAGSTTRPTFEEQLDDPYALWGMRVTPAISTTFRRNGQLRLVFLIYNTTADRDDKPDLEVRYTFTRRTGETDSPFTRTRPQLFNSRTLRPEFSLAAGDLILAGQDVPLAAFEDGHYRLAIEVFDRIAAASVVRNVDFSVAGP